MKNIFKRCLLWCLKVCTWGDCLVGICVVWSLLAAWFLLPLGKDMVGIPGVIILGLATDDWFHKMKAKHLDKKNEND